jgi:hypothetical protein
MGTDDKVAGGSETQLIIFDGIGKKQIGQSSFGGGSLNSTHRVARRHVLYMVLYASANVCVDKKHYNI